MTIEEASEKLSRDYNRFIEVNLITHIEKIEGRVPSNEEVKEHGSCNVYHDGGRKYFWKVQPIFRALSPMQYLNSGVDLEELTKTIS